MYSDQRRGDSWKLNDLRALLFGPHYARESKATSSPLAVEGFSRESVKEKLKKMRKVLGVDVMNFATSSTDVDELNAIDAWCASWRVCCGSASSRRTATRRTANQRSREIAIQLSRLHAMKFSPWC